MFNGDKTKQSRMLGIMKWLVLAKAFVKFCKIVYFVKVTMTKNEIVYIFMYILLSYMTVKKNQREERKVYPRHLQNA